MKRHRPVARRAALYDLTRLTAACFTTNTFVGVMLPATFGGAALLK
jgi:hypothetical protein